MFDVITANPPYGMSIDVSKYNYNNYFFINVKNSSALFL